MQPEYRILYPSLRENAQEECLNLRRKISGFGKAVVSAGVLSALLLFAGAPRTRADRDDRAKCHRRIERAEAKYDKAVRRHGERSRQADEERRELNAARERCWSEFHGWWNGRERRWHEDRDWDRDDRDRDRDHH
jgi:hypothetical protein